MKQYSFYNVDLLIDGLRVDGFRDGNSIISAHRISPQHTGILDAYGKLAVATSSDMSGMITFPLLQTADWNEILYSKAQLTQATGTSGNKSLWTPIQVKLVDKMGDVEVTGINGFIPKQPGIIRGRGFTDNLWGIFVERIQFKSGSYADIGV